MVIWCFGLSNSVYNHFVDLDKVWAPALHTFLPDPWVKMILWGTSSPTAWSFFEHKCCAQKSWCTASSGAPQAHCIPWGGSVGPGALGLAPAHSGASASDQSMCSPCRTQCCAPAWGWVIYASLIWGGVATRYCLWVWSPLRITVWLASCKMKIITSFTSLALVHFPRLLWKLISCFWSTRVV